MDCVNPPMLYKDHSATEQLEDDRSEHLVASMAEQMY